MKYRNGEILICIKSIYIGDRLISKGKIYTLLHKTDENWSDYDRDYPYFVINDHNGPHGLSESFVDEHFKVVRAEKLKRIMR